MFQADAIAFWKVSLAFLLFTQLFGVSAHGKRNVEINSSKCLQLHLKRILLFPLFLSIFRFFMFYITLFAAFIAVFSPKHVEWRVSFLMAFDLWCTFGFLPIGSFISVHRAHPSFYRILTTYMVYRCFSLINSLSDGCHRNCDKEGYNYARQIFLACYNWKKVRIRMKSSGSVI